MKLLITTSAYPDAGLEIVQNKCEVIQSKHSGFDDHEQSKAEIEKLITGVDGIIWCTKVYLGKELLDKAGKNLKVVSTMSAGLDNIDVKEVKSRGIVLGNTPDVLNSSVADVAVLLMISASRRIRKCIKEIESGQWQVMPNNNLGQDIKGSTVGIVGLGKIGQAVAKRLLTFDIKEILYTGHKEKEEGCKLKARFVSLDQLLRESDFIILSCPLTDETRNLIDEKQFSKMKSNAVLVNISRGGVVNQDDLVNALKSEKIFAAGLDVTTPEPLPNDHPLCSLPNCFLTPHIGSATIQTRNDMAQLSALNALLGMNGDPLLTPV